MTRTIHSLSLIGEKGLLLHAFALSSPPFVMRRDVYLLSVSVFFLGLLSAAPILTSHPFMLSQSAMYLSSAGFCLLLGFGEAI